MQLRGKCKRFTRGIHPEKDKAAFMIGSYLDSEPEGRNQLDLQVSKVPVVIVPILLNTHSEVAALMPVRGSVAYVIPEYTNVIRLWLEQARGCLSGFRLELESSAKLAVRIRSAT